MKTLICQYCSNKYLKGNTKVYRSHFCSRKCTDMARRKRFTINCLICNKEKIYTTGRLKYGRAKFCSRECYFKHLSIIYVGSGGSNWQGGKNTLRERIRNMGNFLKWRKEILKRDNYKCTECESPIDLEVDHYPVQLSKIISDVIKKETDIDKAYLTLKSNSLLWNTNNGRTLCVRCHRLTKTYGSKRYITTRP